MSSIPELAFYAGAAYSSWQVLGRWAQHKLKRLQHVDTETSVAWVEAYLQAAKAAGHIETEDLSKVTGQPQLFESWIKLTAAQKVSLLKELYELADWSGQLQNRKKLLGLAPLSLGTDWSTMTDAQRVEFMRTALFGVDYGFIQLAKERGRELAEKQTVWQLTAPLPLVLAEASEASGPLQPLDELKKAVPGFEGQVKAALDEARKSKLSALQSSVKQLAIVETSREVTVLRAELQTKLALNASGKTKRAQELKALLETLELLPAGGAEARAAAAARLDHTVSEALAPERAKAEKELAAQSVTLLAEHIQAQIKTNDSFAARDVDDAVVGLDVVLDQLEDYESLTKIGRDVYKALLRELAGELNQQRGAKGPGEDEEEEGNGIVPPEQERAKALAEAVEALQLLLEHKNEADVVAGDDAAQAEVPRDPRASRGDAISRVRTLAWQQLDPQADALPAPQQEQKAALLQRATAAVDAEKATLQEQLERSFSSLAEAKRQQVVHDRLAHEPEAEGAEGDSSEEELYDKLLLQELYLQRLPKKPAPEMLAAVAAFVKRGLPGGVQLEDGSSRAGYARLEAINRELQLIETVTKLELAPGIVDSLQQIQSYLESLIAPAPTAPNGPDAVDATAAAGSSTAAASALPAGTAEALQQKVDSLLGRGLLLLELAPEQYRTLAVLRDATEHLSAANVDGMVYNKLLTQIREAAAQVGPISSAIDAKIEAAGATTEEESAASGASGASRLELLQQQRSSAVLIYQALQTLLQYEDSVRATAVKALAKVKETVSSVTIPDSTLAFKHVSKALDDTEVLLHDIGSALDKLQPAAGPAGDDESADAGGERQQPAQPTLGAAQESVQQLTSAVGAARDAFKRYLPYAELRNLVTNLEITASVETSEEGLGLRTPDQLGISELHGFDPEDVEAFGHTGLTEIARGRVAVVLCAGGEVDGRPRGTMDLPLASGKCLFQIYAERLLRLQQLGAESLFGPRSAPVNPIYWHIMTTPSTHDKIVRFFASRRYFGLQPTQVRFFVNDIRVPVVDQELRLVAEAPGKLARVPASSGEVFRRLQQSGGLRHMLRSGVRHVEVVDSDDNLLARLADPVLIGVAVTNQLEAAAKVVDQSAVAGAYSQVLDHLQGDLADRLLDLAPGISSYYFSAATLRAICERATATPQMFQALVPRKLPKNRAGQSPAGYTFTRPIAQELFHPSLAGKVTLLGVERDEEFAPLWGAAPYYVTAAPDVAVADLLTLHTSWVEDSGGVVLSEQGVEVSPLLSYGGEGLQRIAEGRVFPEVSDNALNGADIPHGSRTNLGPWIVPFGLAYVGVAVMSVLNKAAPKKSL